MSDSEVAGTRAAAEAQEIVLPKNYEQWSEFAYLLNGYKVAEDMGFDLLEWQSKRLAEYEATGRWNANVLELRLLLFAQARAARFSWGEPFDLVDSLLHELARQTGQHYETDSALRTRYQNQTPEDTGIIIEDPKPPAPRRKRSKRKG